MDYKCCLCGATIVGGYGNDPWPLQLDGVCCDICSVTVVIPERMKRMQHEQEDTNK